MGEPQQNEDVIHRLEAAIGRWSAELAEAQSGLDRGFSKVRDYVGTAASAQGAPVTEALRAVAETLGEIRTAVTALAERASAVEQAVIQAVAGARAVREDEGRPDARRHGLAGRIDRLADEVAGLKAALSQRDAAEDDSGRSALDAAEQLSRALRDRDEAHQEIVRLRQRLDAARAAAERKERERERPAAGAEPAAFAGGEPVIGPLEAFDADGQRRRMAEILVRAGVLTIEQVQETLAMQEREPHKRLGSILVEQGLVSEAIVGRVLASQLRLPFVVLGREAPDAAAEDMVGRKLASHHQCFPVRADGARLVLAMANPLDLIAIEDVELATGRRVDPVVAAGEEIRAAIERAYGPAVPT